jgi:hypothetical protein
LHAALQAHTRQPDATAARLAEELAAGLGKTITAGHVRVMLHRARARFAELLVAEVTQSLGSPTEADLLEELRKLSLLRLCGPALERRGQDAGASTGGKDLPRAGEQAVAQSERRK